MLWEEKSLSERRAHMILQIPNQIGQALLNSSPAWLLPVGCRDSR